MRDRRSTRPRLAAASALMLLAAGCATDGERPEGTGGAASVAASPLLAVEATGSPAAVLSATVTFITMLNSTQRSELEAGRTRATLSQWSNLPDQLFERAGLRMDGLGEEQRAAAHDILRAGLSPDGYQQVAGITTADGVLAESAQTNLDFGADHYWIRILGTPSASKIWTVQYGGHHLAVNMTMKGRSMTISPTLWGAQPASYAEGGATTEPLSGETRKAFALMASLGDEQLATAVLDTPVTEIVLGAGQDRKAVAYEGVRADDFNAEQIALLTNLMAEWIGTVNPTAAKARLAEAEREVDDTWFAWSGPTTIGNPIYYRVTSPSYLIEFAHQQGQGANAGGITHIHAIYREIGNDYGADL
jgi:hypothetical protein